MLWMAIQGFQSDAIKTDYDVSLNMLEWFQIAKKIQMNGIRCVLVGYIWIWSIKANTVIGGFPIRISDNAPHGDYHLGSYPPLSLYLPHLTGIPLVSIRKCPSRRVKVVRYL